MNHTRHKPPRGYLMLLSLVFGAIFLTVLGALASFALTQNRVQIATESRTKALTLAEAGLEYYHWYLAHYPSVVSTTSVITYNDPETGNSLGTISLAVTANQSCGQTTSVDLVSKGTPADNTNTSRSIYTRYLQPSVGDYSYIVNDNVWAGADRTINGPYHSNGGIRMDATTNSSVTSSLSTWTCTIGYGCSPDTVQPGVFGAGTNPSLWQNSTPQVDFSGIATNFTSLKTIAVSSGLDLPRVSTGTGAPSSNGNKSGYWNGYHLVFTPDGKVAVYQVTQTLKLSDTPINSTIDPSTDYTVIQSENLISNYTLLPACGLIFVEDNVWIEGAIPQKVTVVSANVNPSLVGVTTNIMIPNNIAYSGTNAGLTAIAQNDVLVTANSPSVLTLNGIFVAQAGSFGRNLYACPSVYEPRTTLTIHGTTVSYKRTGTKWTGGCGGGVDAGYQSRIDGFDSSLASNPPPFTPVLTTVYQFRDWREK